MSQYYDIIGDIHGYADALEALLKKLGYKYIQGAFQHEKHKVIFLGDFIDRGLQQRQVIEIVRPMIEQGHAFSVMGNHEFNAICYASIGEDRKPLRQHSVNKKDQHEAFLSAYTDEVERQEIIDWFKTLPVFIETDDIRVIHACWNDHALEKLNLFLNDQNCINDEAYEACSQKGSDAFDAIETLLKGPEVGLPHGVTFRDSYIHKRKRARIKWWLSNQFNIEDRLFLGEKVTQIHKLSQVDLDDSYHYAPENKPVFIGHYWLDQSEPTVLLENCACLDFSVAKQGKLVAYQWRGESLLDSNNFRWC